MQLDVEALEVLYALPDHDPDVEIASYCARDQIEAEQRLAYVLRIHGTRGWVKQPVVQYFPDVRKWGWKGTRRA